MVEWYDWKAARAAAFKRHEKRAAKGFSINDDWILPEDLRQIDEHERKYKQEAQQRSEMAEKRKREQGPLTVAEMTRQLIRYENARNRGQYNPSEQRRSAALADASRFDHADHITQQNAEIGLVKSGRVDDWKLYRDLKWIFHGESLRPLHGKKSDQ